MAPVSLGTMIEQLDGLRDTTDLTEWETGFVNNIVETTTAQKRTRAAFQLRRLNPSSASGANILQGDADITEAELHEAFDRSGLWRRGWTYKRAISTTLVQIGLLATVRAWHRSQQKNGKPAPVQQALI
jgi:hypothetical protein